MEHLRGVVERITYQNEENGYSVLKCRVKNYTDLVTVVGSMPEVHVGSVLYLGGNWRVDPKYGRQFSMETFEETLPATVYGIEKYLGSGLVKGIGPKFAKKIVQQFGKDTLDVIEEDPDRLNEIPGIGKKRVDRIKQSWQEQKEIKNIMLFLQGHDVSTAHATKIYKTYGNDSIKTVQENPYKLADDIWGIGFKTADTIAEKMGFGHEKYARLRSGILYTLNKLSEEGHCYATRDMLLKSGAELLGVEENLLSMTLDEMIHAKDVITDDIPKKDDEETTEKAIYLPPFYFSEVGTVKRLKTINPGTVGLRRAGVQYRVNDKVMQIRNNYDKEVFNGDMGIITSVDLDEKSLKVNFDGRDVEYDISELDELVLSYATTIHKAQGSEYPIVVMPVLMNHFVMLQRNLIYTGITRAKKILVIVGTKKALAYAVKNVTVEKRNTMLKERLQKVMPQVVQGSSSASTPVQKVEKSKVIQYPQQTRAQKVAEPKQEYGKPSREEWLKEDLFTRPSRSTFRSRFHLSEKDKEYVRQKGMDTIKSHAEDFVAKRLAPAVIPNDGKQTPMRGHPVFIAQHATACCCRGCLQKWHNIPAGRELTKEEQKYVVNVLMEWIRRQMNNG